MKRVEWRVDELSDEVGLSVDTIRYYQAKGLLHPPRREGRVAYYDSGHAERLERIRGLQAKGFTLATIARVIAGELDAADEALVGALAIEALPEHQSLMSLEDLAKRTGIPTPVLAAVEREGLLVPRRVGDEQGYTTDDVAVAKAGLVLLEHGLPLGELLDLARRHHEAMVDVARRAVELFDVYVRQPSRASGEHLGDSGVAGRDVAGLVQAFHALLPATTTLVSHHFTRVLLESALEHIEHVGDDDERMAIRRAGQVGRS